MHSRPGFLLTAIVVLGCTFTTACSNSGTSMPAAESSASAPEQASAPSPTPSTTSQASGEAPDIRYYAPGQIGIPAGLSDEDLVAAFIEKSTAWNMAGTSPEIYERQIKKAPGADLQYESGLAHGVYVSELFADNRDRVIDEFLSQRMDRVQKVARLYMESAPQAQAQPDLYEPYKQWFELLAINSTSGTAGGSRTINIDYVLRSNDEKTQPSFGKPLQHPPYPNRVNVAFDESSGHALITDVVMMQLR